MKRRCTKKPPQLSVAAMVSSLQNYPTQVGAPQSGDALAYNPRERMTALERSAAKALAACRFLPGSWSKKFAADMGAHASAGTTKITLKQRTMLWRLVNRYRRQIRPDLVAEAKRFLSGSLAPLVDLIGEAEAGANGDDAKEFELWKKATDE